MQIQRWSVCWWTFTGYECLSVWSSSCVCSCTVALLERCRDIWQSWQCLSPVLLVVVCVRCHLLILSCLQLAVQPSVTVRSLLPVHERGTTYHLTFEHLHHHSTRSRNIWNPTSFSCLFPACRACDYVYIDYVRRSRSSSCRLLHPINCQTYITLHYITCTLLYLLLMTNSKSQTFCLLVPLLMILCDFYGHSDALRFNIYKIIAYMALVKLATNWYS